MEGNILVAHPLLHDGFFNRSVVYVTNHNLVESLGFVLNFKTEFKLSDVKPEIKYACEVVHYACINNT